MEAFQNFLAAAAGAAFTVLIVTLAVCALEVRSAALAWFREQGPGRRAATPLHYTAASSRRAAASPLYAAGPSHRAAASAPKPRARAFREYDLALRTLEAEQGEWFVRDVLEREVAKLYKFYARFSRGSPRSPAEDDWACSDSEECECLCHAELADCECEDGCGSDCECQCHDECDSDCDCECHVPEEAEEDEAYLADAGDETDDDEYGAEDDEDVDEADESDDEVYETDEADEADEIDGDGVVADEDVEDELGNLAAGAGSSNGRDGRDRAARRSAKNETGLRAWREGRWRSRAAGVSRRWAAGRGQARQVQGESRGMACLGGQR